MDEYNRNRGNYEDSKIDSWAGQPRAGISHIFDLIGVVNGKPNLDELKVLSSTK